MTCNTRSGAAAPGDPAGCAPAKPKAKITNRAAGAATAPVIRRRPMNHWAKTAEIVSPMPALPLRRAQ